MKPKDDIKRYIILIALLLAPISCSNDQKMETHMDHVKILDLSQYAAAPPEKPIQLLFIHHSTGGQLLADTGPDIGQNCIFKSNPNGGGLRHLLEDNNYVVHEASYGSLIGDKTDICHWNKKFREQMVKILKCKNQDESFTDSTVNRIVMFKSCFPNSWIESEGKDQGDPDSTKQTTSNYKAVYNALREYFQKQPGTLFVVVTAPPLVKPEPNRVKESIKGILGREDTVEKVGRRVRGFNNWLKDIENGWLKGYQLTNVVVFDYYDVLTGHGQSDWSLYPTGGGADSHPSSDGNTIAAKEFIPFLNRSVHRVGW